MLACGCTYVTPGPESHTVRTHLLTRQPFRSLSLTHQPTTGHQPAAGAVIVTTHSDAACTSAPLASYELISMHILQKWEYSGGVGGNTEVRKTVCSETTHHNGVTKQSRLRPGKCAFKEGVYTWEEQECALQSNATGWCSTCTGSVYTVTQTGEVYAERCVSLHV